MIGFLVVSTLLVWWLVARRRRAVRLSGLTAERPVFNVEPPRRRVGRLKDELL